MKDIRGEARLAAGLIAASFVLYLFHFLIFQDGYHIWYYLISDIAFLPIQVILVTLILDRLLEQREKEARLEKLNVLISTFFSQAGSEMLSRCTHLDPTLDLIQNALLVQNEWKDQDFAGARRRLSEHSFQIAEDRVDLPSLARYLQTRSDLMLRLLENPMIFEHESFTKLLLALSHLTEELEARTDLTHLPPADVAHIAGDIKRVYGLLVGEWLNYMWYLKNNYPYLFSLAMRKNPFDRGASPIIT
jgi:hypothetical protein